MGCIDSRPHNRQRQAGHTKQPHGKDKVKAGGRMPGKSGNSRSSHSAFHDGTGGWDNGVSYVCGGNDILADHHGGHGGYSGGCDNGGGHGGDSGGCDNGGGHGGDSGGCDSGGGHGGDSGGCGGGDSGGGGGDSGGCGD